MKSQEVCEKVTEAIACGAVQVLGTVEEVRARGTLPLHLNPLTVETSKLRLCVNQRKLNLMSKWPKVELDGLQSIEDDVRGRAVHGAVADEASGYQHHRLSEDSQDLFGVVFLGHVLVYTVLTFGWGPSCHYHQGHGMIPVGYHRSLGGLVELYIGESQFVRRRWSAALRTDAADSHSFLSCAPIVRRRPHPGGTERSQPCRDRARRVRILHAERRVWLSS